MPSLLLVALAAAAPVSAAPDLDLRCYRLMAEMTEADDPRVRGTAMVAAQYFLGRLDSAGRASDLDAPRTEAEAREPLLRRCGEAMQAGGHDFRTIGESLQPRSRPGA